jgi:hypothetical protein
MPTSAMPLAPARERIVLWLLALTQFTVIMDFMVMMPLAPQLMRAFDISPAAVSGAVSAYAWCAGISGLLAAMYIDRFDRKRLLLTMFALFTVSNLACAVAPNFHVLVLSRVCRPDGRCAGLDHHGHHRRSDPGRAARCGHRHRDDLVQSGRSGGRADRRDAGGPLWLGGAVLSAGSVLAADLGGGWRVLPTLDGHLARRVPLAQVLPELLALYRVAGHLKPFCCPA